MKKTYFRRCSQSGDRRLVSILVLIMLVCPKIGVGKQGPSELKFGEEIKDGLLPDMFTLQDMDREGKLMSATLNNLIREDQFRGMLPEGKDYEAWEIQDQSGLVVGAYPFQPNLLQADLGDLSQFTIVRKRLTGTGKAHPSDWAPLPSNNINATKYWDDKVVDTWKTATGSGSFYLNLIDHQINSTPGGQFAFLNTWAKETLPAAIEAEKPGVRFLSLKDAAVERERIENREKEWVDLRDPRWDAFEKWADRACDYIYSGRNLEYLQDNFVPVSHAVIRSHMIQEKDMGKCQEKVLNIVLRQSEDCNVNCMLPGLEYERQGGAWGEEKRKIRSRIKSGKDDIVSGIKSGKDGIVNGTKAVGARLSSAGSATWEFMGNVGEGISNKAHDFWTFLGNLRLPDPSPASDRDDAPRQTEHHWEQKPESCHTMTNPVGGSDIRYCPQ